MIDDQTDFGLQEKLLNDQRQRYAQQASQGIPQGQFVGNRFVRPNNLELLAAAIRNAGGMIGQNQAMQSLQELQGKRQQAQTQDMSKFVDLLRGTPGREAVQGSDSSVMPEYQDAKQATPGSPTDAYAMALRSQSPQLQQIGIKGMESMPALQQRMEEKLSDQEFRRQQLQDQLAARKDQMIAQQEFQKGMRADARAAALANRPERQAQIIQTEQGPMQLVGGRAVPILGLGGEQVKGTKESRAEKPLTEGQAKAVAFASRMDNSDSIINDLSKKGINVSTPGSRAGFGVGAVIGALQSAERQQLDQAKRDFVNAVLRRESGAVISDTEFANADQQYFPQVGDSPAVISQKAKNRKISLEGMKADIPKGSTVVSDILGKTSTKLPSQGGVKFLGFE